MEIVFYQFIQDGLYMLRLIVFLAVQSLIVLYVFPSIHEDFRVQGEFKGALIVVILFIVFNWVFRRLFVIFTMGIGWIAYYLSLGFLGLVANAVVLLAIDKFFHDLLHVPNFGSAFAGGLLLAIASFFLGRKKDD